MIFSCAVFWDFVVIVILIYFIIEAAKQGLIASVINLFRCAVSYFLASVLSATITKYCYDTFVKFKIADTISEKINGVYTDSLDTNSILVLKKKFETVSKYVPFLNLSDFCNKISGFNSDVIAKNITSMVIYPIIKCIFGIILFFFIYNLCKVLIKKLVLMTNVINHIPVLGEFNSLLGVLFGFFKATLLIFILTGIMNIIIVITDNALPCLNAKIINRSYLIKYFFEISKILYKFV